MKERKLSSLFSVFSRFSIRTELIISVVTIVLILGLSMGAYLNTVQKDQMIDQLDDKGSAIIRSLAGNAINPILTENDIDLRRLIENTYESEQDIAYVFLLDENGIVIAHTFEQGFPVELKTINPADGNEVNIQVLDIGDTYVRDLSYPVLGGSLGEVHMGLSEKRINSVIAKSNYFMAGFVLILIFVGTEIAYWFGNIISRPIIELKKGVEAFGKGNYSRKITIESYNEIGDLALSFNDMATNISSLLTKNEASTREIIDTKNYLDAIISGSHDGIAVLEDTYNFEYVNRAFASMTMYETSEIIGKRLSFIFQDLILPSKEQVFNKGLHELKATKKNGKYLSCLVSVTRTDVKGKPKVILIAKDITSFKVVEEMKHNILSSFSHELRTPLHLMKGFVSVAMEEDDRDRRNYYLFNALKAIERQNWMVQDLIEVAVNNRGTYKLELSELDVDNLISRAIESVKEKAVNSEISIESSIEPGLKVNADAEKLTYALVKLLDNGIKFNKTGGKVRVNVVEKDSFVRIMIEDTGIGITLEDQEHIFERFYQADGSIKRKYGGNGLGLSIAKDIALTHGGDLWVESEIGRGSIFYLTIPSAPQN